MKQVSKLLNGMNVLRTSKLARGVLTSDLHGGCGPKLTHGFYINTIGWPGYTAGRPPRLIEAKERRMTRKFLESLLHFRSGWRANHAL